MIRNALALGFAVAVAAAASGATAATPPFVGKIAPLSAAQRERMTGVSWQPGCPVQLADLRLLTVSHWGFDGRRRTGRLVVHETAAGPLRSVFRRLYEARFPVRKLVPIDAYGGSDFRSIEADNTVGVQLPARDRLEQLVRARVRPRHRRQPDREPVRRERARVPRREPFVRLPAACTQGHGRRRWDARGCVRRDRLGMGRTLVGLRQGLPALLCERSLVAPGRRGLGRRATSAVPGAAAAAACAGDAWPYSNTVLRAARLPSLPATPQRR